jgi:hypothetical protein
VDQSRILLFILVAGIMPFIWGYAVHWLMLKLWPQPEAQPAKSTTVKARSMPPLDYQI